MQAIRHRRALVATDVQAPVIRTRRVLREGLIVGLTNPKMIVFFAAALPQFIDRDAGHVPLQMVALGSIVPVVAMVCDSVWALAAGTARTWFAGSERRIERMSTVGGRDDRRRNHPGPVRRPRGALIADSPAVRWMG